jgi:glycosyltransferase involved in cell wall biosynthesis
MRVLYANHTSEVSGSERSLLTLLETPPAGVSARAAVPAGKLARAIERLCVPVDTIASTSGSLRLHPAHTPLALAQMSLAALQMDRLARTHSIEVVHANSIRAGLELSFARARAVARVVHVRDCLPSGTVTSATFRILARSADTMVANSDYTAAIVRRHAPHARLEVVHPAIDIERFDPRRIDRAASRSTLGIPGRRRWLLGVVAQLSPWKGQDTAIEALQIMLEQGLDAHLLLIGSPKFAQRSTRLDNTTYVRDLRRLIGQRGLGDRVTLMGERDDIPELMRALDVLLLPSHEEPFGRALLEALALEVPVVATSVGGPPELVRDGREGRLAPPRDPAAWARTILSILAREDHGADFARAGRERIRQAFTVQHQSTAMRGVYERALLNRVRRHGRRSAARGSSG